MFYTIGSSYSHVLYGYSVQPSKADNDVLEMKTIFIYKAHTACIKAMAAHNNLLLSGSDDEAIKWVI